MKVLLKLDIDHHYHHQFYGYLALHKSTGFPRNIAKPSSLLWENTESTLLQNEIPICPQKAQNQPILTETYFVNHAIFKRSQSDALQEKAFVVVVHVHAPHLLKKAELSNIEPS